MALPGRILKFQSAKEAVTEEVRGLIHRGELPPGERISIEDLATSFGVSRTPVRDAVFQLNGEGLVAIQPRVGVFVREIGAEEILDVYHMKGVLEPLMAEWAAERGSEERRQQFYASVSRLDEAAHDSDVELYVSRLESRRTELLEMARSQALADCLKAVDGRVRLLRFRNLSQPGQLLRSAEQHRAIAQAVAAGDIELAGRAMRHHTRDALVRIQGILGNDARPMPSGAALDASEQTRAS